MSWIWYYSLAIVGWWVSFLDGTASRLCSRDNIASNRWLLVRHPRLFVEVSGTYSSHPVDIISACALPISACLAVVVLLLARLGCCVYHCVNSLVRVLTINIRRSSNFSCETPIVRLGPFVYVKKKIERPMTKLFSLRDPRRGV